MLPAGSLADRFGRKPVLIGGLALFTAASFFCGAASNLPVLIAARAVQGVGAALQLSAGLATLSASFHGDARARAFAFWGSVVGIGITLGPIAGGLITQSFGWQWAFYINLPVGIATIALIVFVVEDSRDPHALRIDLAGVVTFGAFLFLTVLALISGNHDGWTDPAIRTELVAAAVCFGLFILVERRQARPMLDLSFFALPTYLGANIAQLVFAAALLTMLTFMPLYFQAALDLPPRTAGLRMLPMALPLFIVPRIVTAQLSHRLSGRALLTLGLAIVCIGLLVMALAVGAQGDGTVLAGMLIAGVGAGLLNGETTKVGMTVIPPERAGMASGVSGTMRFTGIVIGFAALGVVLFSRIANVVTAALPSLDAGLRTQFIRDVASGHLSATGVSAEQSAAELDVLAHHAFAEGYEALLLAGAGLAGVAALAVWCLVRAADTMPIAKKPRGEPVATVEPIAIE
jgi:EmrB/QacA subfamily drug resistance transporter